MKTIIRASSLIIASLIAVLAFNFLSVILPINAELSKDKRNEKISVITHYGFGIDITTLVIDVWEINETASMADVDRVLFTIAQTFQEKTFNKIILANRTIWKFQINSGYFKRIGQEFAWQNPIYLIRNLPENTYMIDGNQAFSSWTGGWLGVVNKQMEDHNKLHRDWYINADTIR